MNPRGWAVALLALGCTACGGTTGGHLIQIPLEAGGIQRDASQPLTFSTGQGWTVTLTEARVVLGPLYFNIDAPSSIAFRSGVVIVQATEQFIVDMLDPTLQTVSGGADGETGTAVSVEIGFFTSANGYNNTIPLPPPLAESGEEGTAFLAGQASKGGVIVPFAGRVQITDALVTALNPIGQVARVAGAYCNLTFTETSGTLQLRVNPSHWFDQADFCGLVSDAPVAARPEGPDAGADGGAADAAPSEGGAADTSPSEGGASAATLAPCSPVAGSTYGWSDTAPFNSAVLGAMKASLGVYGFSLSP
jgi:hypothetical protein